MRMRRQKVAYVALWTTRALPDGTSFHRIQRERSRLQRLIDSRMQFSCNQGSAAAAKYTQGLHL